VRLLRYGFRRGVPMWAAALAFVFAAASAVSSASEAGRLLETAGLTDPAGMHRARLWSLFGLFGFALATWRGAELGGLLAGRDRGWIAPRPASRSALAATALLGSAAAAWLFVVALGIGVELRAGGGPGRQLLAAPSGPAVLRLAAEPAAARRASWQVAAAGELPVAAQLELLVRPLAGGGRSAALTLATSAGQATFTIGAVRRVDIGLDASGALELEHGDTGPALAIFPAEARITAPVASRRRTSLALGLGLGILITTAAAMAMGLGTRLGAGLATLLTFAILGSIPAFGVSDWFTALVATEVGLVPHFPQATVWLTLALSLGLGWALVTRALGRALGTAKGTAQVTITRGGQA